MDKWKKVAWVFGSVGVGVGVCLFLWSEFDNPFDSLITAIFFSFFSTIEFMAVFAFFFFLIREIDFRHAIWVGPLVDLLFKLFYAGTSAHTDQIYSWIFIATGLAVVIGSVNILFAHWLLKKA